MFSNEVLSRKFENLEKRSTQRGTILVSIVEEKRSLIESPKAKKYDPIGF